MLQFATYPLYSVDASALIDFKDYYPADVFPSMWEFVGSMAAQNRLLVCEEVAAECRDPELRGLIASHPEMVISFEHTQDHFRRLQFEAPDHGMELVDPSSTTSAADPFVVALALMLEQRDLQDLRRKMDPDAQCMVVTHEAPKGPGGRWVKIPNVCQFYGLSWIKWLTLLKREGYAG